jgi:hypothetical protein
LHHQRLTELKMRLLGDQASRRTAWRIAREQGWETTYDAEYLAVTESTYRPTPLVTVNPALAMKARGVVPPITPDAPNRNLDVDGCPNRKPFTGRRSNQSRGRPSACKWDGDRDRFAANLPNC